MFLRILIYNHGFSPPCHTLTKKLLHSLYSIVYPSRVGGQWECKGFLGNEVVGSASVSKEINVMHVFHIFVVCLNSQVANWPDVQHSVFIKVSKLFKKYFLWEDVDGPEKGQGVSVPKCKWGWRLKCYFLVEKLHQ